MIVICLLLVHWIWYRVARCIVLGNDMTELTSYYKICLLFPSKISTPFFFFFVSPRFVVSNCFAYVDLKINENESIFYFYFFNSNDGLSLYSCAG